MKILQIQNLHKRYGRIHAVNNLSLEIEKGMIYGILGPNGSGKTTTLGMILGIIHPNSGQFQWFEGQFGENPRRKMGALLETPNFYPYLNAVDNLALVAHIKKVGTDQIDELLELVNLAHRKHSKFKTYSLGMKQRLAIAAAMIGNPEVLIFDEPTNGLDPQGIAEVRSTILKIAETGKTIIMASHILDEVEKICSHVAIMKNGKLLATGTVGSIINDDITIEVSSQQNASLKDLLSKDERINQISELGDKLVLQVDKTLEAWEINQLAASNNIFLHHLVSKTKSLEDEFLEITKASN
jgi:ABC-2 type transport system ATP-binding protein